MHRQAPDGEGSPAVAGEAVAVALHGLKVALGPDLRVMYPMNVMNFGIAGDLLISGPAEPDKLRVAGSIR